MEVLLCEDDDLLARGLLRSLRKAGYQPTRTTSLASTRRHLNAHRSPDIALVDLNLPDGHGSQVVHALRTHRDVGIIIITAQGDERSRVLGLRAGADDYVVKPFGVAELLARIEAVARRTAQIRQQHRSRAVAVPGFEFDVVARQLISPTETITLTRTESAILDLLTAAPDGIVSRTEILEQLWPEAPQASSRSLDTHIAALRRKLPESAQIRTLHGTGYQLLSGDQADTA